MGAIPLKYYKYVRLVINFTAWIALGANNEILSPTLPDLSIRVGADYQEIGRTVGLRVIGSIFVPVISGMIYDRFPRVREIGLGVIIALTSLLSIGVPYCTQIWMLTLILVSQGIIEGGLATSAQSIIIELFGTAAASALQFMHLGWAVGSFLANIIVRPFLAPNIKLSKKKIRYQCLEGINDTTGNSSQTTTLDNSGSRIEYAYFIIGIYGIVIGAILIAFSFAPKPRNPNDSDSNANAKRSLNHMIGPSEISDGRTKFGVFMLISLCLIYFTDVGAYVIFSRFLVTVAIDPCKDFMMTQVEATTLKSVVTGVSCAGRVMAGIIIGILLMKKIQPGFVIVVSSIGMGLTSTLLCFGGLRNRDVFWASSALYAFFHAPEFGGVTPWFNQYIRVTSTVIAVAITGSSVGKFAFSWIAGYIFKAHGSQVFLYLDSAIIIILVIIVITVFIVSTTVGKRPTYETHGPSNQVNAVEEKRDDHKQNVQEDEKNSDHNEMVTKI